VRIYRVTVTKEEKIQDTIHTVIKSTKASKIQGHSVHGHHNIIEELQSHSIQGLRKRQKLQGHSTQGHHIRKEELKNHIGFPEPQHRRSPQN
jgi:hypothetical protein